MKNEIVLPILISIILSVLVSLWFAYIHTPKCNNQDVQTANTNLIDFSIMLKTNPHAKGFEAFAATNGNFKYVGEEVKYEHPDIMLLRFKKVK